MSKGDWPRPYSPTKYGDNFDQIDWSKPKAVEPMLSPSTMGKTALERSCNIKCSDCDNSCDCYNDQHREIPAPQREILKSFTPSEEISVLPSETSLRCGSACACACASEESCSAANEICPLDVVEIPVSIYQTEITQGNSSYYLRLPIPINKVKDYYAASQIKIVLGYNDDA